MESGEYKKNSIREWFQTVPLHGHFSFFFSTMQSVAFFFALCSLSLASAETATPQRTVSMFISRLFIRTYIVDAL